jgi:hypothetical protein
MLLAEALARNVQEWILFHLNGPKSLLNDKLLRSMLLSASQAFEAGLASPDEDDRRQCEIARRRFTKTLNAQLQQTERLLCPTAAGGEAADDSEGFRALSGGVINVVALLLFQWEGWCGTQLVCMASTATSCLHVS